jgi:O-antigen ligase
MAAPPVAVSRPRGRLASAAHDPRVVRAAGAGLFAAVGAWTLVSTAVSGGHPAGELALLAAAAGSLVAGNRLARVRRWIVPALVLAAAGALAVGAGAISRGPARGPFGYANATGGFYALAAFAGLMLVVSSESTAGKALALAGALGCAAVPFAVHAAAASGVAVVLPIAALAGVTAGRPWAGIAAVGALAMLALAVTVTLGAIHEPGGSGGVESALTGRRVELWHEALQLMGERPVTGVGPVRFAVMSTTARGDADARWAHNEFLQQGAETGMPGMVLLVLLFGWALWALAVAGGDAFAAFGATAVAALGIGASVDYLLHFAALPVTAAALAGAAMRPATRT